MHKSLTYFLFICTVFNVHAQYTETINSNRPGESQGGFAVGKGVIQLEGGGYMGNDDHALYRQETDVFGAMYGLRIGLLTENLELNLFGSFQDETTSVRIGNREQEAHIRNFRTNTFGAKYLVYDPYKNAEEDKPNLYSWKANRRFKWKTLIPAISVYGGGNFSVGENPYLYPGESKLSPKAAIITQNNWGRWVLVMNFIADKFTEEFPSYGAIATVTHAVSPKFALFGEYQGYISDLYADDIVRGGAAYLLFDNLQMDISGLINFKDTPSRWQIAGGFSYRLDFHKDDEILGDSVDEARDNRKQRSQNSGFQFDDEE
ncbi:transporter [Salegentibacter sp. F188]|uniref:Transporter n=1 Tax=Autumnicola patrickiae TaxID=3075591 RepID=A0ABU3E3P9_9FLAO|nr:transporter [Salegentibacter sp. F188]MDT0690535.1 transporter [Salegentibacter sp. F188]